MDNALLDNSLVVICYLCLDSYILCSNIRLLSTSLALKKRKPCKGKIRLFRSWNAIPRAQYFKPKFEFQTSLAQNTSVGT